MVYGKAILCSDLPACQEILGECGAYFKLHRRQDLKEQMVGLMADPGRVEVYGRKARERVVAQYGWDKVADDVEALYLSMMKR